MQKCLAIQQQNGGPAYLICRPVLVKDPYIQGMFKKYNHKKDILVSDSTSKKIHFGVFLFFSKIDEQPVSVMLPWKIVIVGGYDRLVTLFVKAAPAKSIKLLLRKESRRTAVASLPCYSSYVTVLGIETSCDDTGCGIVRSDKRVLGQCLVSQHQVTSR